MLHCTVPFFGREASSHNVVLGELGELLELLAHPQRHTFLMEGSQVSTQRRPHGQSVSPVLTLLQQQRFDWAILKDRSHVRSTVASTDDEVLVVAVFLLQPPAQISRVFEDATDWFFPFIGLVNVSRNYHENNFQSFLVAACQNA